MTDEDADQSVAGFLPETSEPDAVHEAAVPPLATLLEAILLVTDEPVPALTLAHVVEQPTNEIESMDISANSGSSGAKEGSSSIDCSPRRSRK